ncbi:hypothetical protein RQP53_00610 [Paucibacter sp. APW11]|uniref:Uncharacterized protein n=1 Tax=Roseateles aquae TaxID=3077235 RepID=A0ABU3P6C5_9BURK|nr:hypothetical protein [Paucibacter sp. APW11]MDT8997770.1 hypothetical protein [Paucibacter sp. APW11]
MLPVCVKTLPSGDQVIAPDETGSCGIYLMSQPDLDVWNQGLYGGPSTAWQTQDQVRAVVREEMPVNPLSLTTEQGLALSAAIAGVWVTAWVVRMLIRVLRADGATE